MPTDIPGNKAGILRGGPAVRAEDEVCDCGGMEVSGPNSGSYGRSCLPERACDAWSRTVFLIENNFDESGGSRMKASRSKNGGAFSMMMFLMNHRC
jgi:hypothetical protein